MPASVARLMLPPDTTQTTLPPLQAVPVLARTAASASAPAPSATTLARSASSRTAAAASATGTATASSTSGETTGHIESSTRLLPDPSTNDGWYATSTGSPAARAAANAAAVAGSAVTIFTSGRNDFTAEAIPVVSPPPP